MIGWFRRRENPKEVFPIENLPLETLGQSGADALSLLYRKSKRALKTANGGRIIRRLVDLDKEKLDFFRKILPILDGFDSIFRYAQNQNIEKDEILSNWLKTLETLYRRLLSALEKEGLVAIESQGKPLDLSMQEVIETRETPGAPDNTVLEEVVKGYTYGNRVLRDSKVIVAKNPGGIVPVEEENRLPELPYPEGEIPEE